MPRRLFWRSWTTARWTTARAVSAGADFRSRVDSPIFSPEKESTGSVASLQAMEREREFEFEFECEFGRNLMGNLSLWCVEELERKIEEEKKEREVEVGVGVSVSVERAAMLGFSFSGKSE